MLYAMEASQLHYQLSTRRDQPHATQIYSLQRAAVAKHHTLTHKQLVHEIYTCNLHSVRLRSGIQVRLWRAISRSKIFILLFQKPKHHCKKIVFQNTKSEITFGEKMPSKTRCDVWRFGFSSCHYHCFEPHSFSIPNS